MLPQLRGSGGVWRRLVARPLWERKVAGSNPTTPTHRQRRYGDNTPRSVEYPFDMVAGGWQRAIRAVPENASLRPQRDVHVTVRVVWADGFDEWLPAREAQ